MFDQSDEEILNHNSDNSDDNDTPPPPRRPRLFKERINFDPFSFQARFRLTAAQTEHVITAIGNHLVHPTQRNCALSPHQQVFVALRYFADGGHLLTIADAHGLHKSTVSRCITNVSEKINTHLFPQLVNWPLGEVERLQIPQWFRDVSNSAMPSVAGCLDGTHIRIIAPSIHEPQFVNRHGEHSINVMAVCGPDARYYYVSAKWPGSVHDRRVLRNSTLFQRFVNGWRPFPQAILLADSAYPCLDWVIPPVANAATDEQHRFNVHHKRMRRLIESAFGILKFRFNCLSYIHMSPHKAANIVKARCTLQNLIILERGEELHLQEDNDVNGFEEMANDEMIQNNYVRRLQLINQFTV